MKVIWCMILLAVQAAGQATQVPERNLVPMEVQRRAQAAVQAAMTEAVKGNFEVLVNQMNPKYLKLETRRIAGGIAGVKADKLRLFKELAKNGVVLGASVARQPNSAMEVDFGIDKEVVEGRRRNVSVYRKWMVIVPTVTDFQVVDRTQKPAKIRKFRKFGFEVAVSPKQGENWTFIPGEGMNPLQLRKMFPFLPRDPKVYRFPVEKTVEITDQGNGR